MTFQKLAQKRTKMCETVGAITPKPLICLCGKRHACKYTTDKRQYAHCHQEGKDSEKQVTTLRLLSLEGLSLVMDKVNLGFKGGKHLVKQSNQL